MKNKINKNKGITLIALVITIVILLILAGIAIASLTGDNGLFARANQARQNTLDAQNKENETLEGYEDAIDYVLGAEVTGVDTSVTNPVEAMPTGATVIQGNASEGIVIRDENGNEWVWVEVPRTSEVYPTAGTDLNVDTISDDECTTIYNDLATYASAYKADGFEDTFYSTEQHGFEDTDAYNTAKNNMLRSIYRNGGFWIGRYEVGDADATASNTTRTKEMGNTNMAVIKANQIPYNYVTCKQAQELSTGLSTGGKTSSLMFGIQWDLICKFLEEKGGLTQAEIKGGDGVGSTNWGNYSDSTILLSQGKYNIFPDSSESQWLDIAQGAKSATMLLTTGASEDTKKMNIYDFAGNECEFTLEYTGKNDTPCSLRGGGYTHNSNRVRASAHHNGGLAYSRDVGFRPSLY